MDDEALARRRARANWPVRKYRLGEEPVDDFSAYTAEERLAMTWQMTKDAWASAGLPMPSYSRSEMPIRVIRKRPAENAGPPKGATVPAAEDAGDER